jgi:putative ribosome biogenesis GTPase RsgA
MQLRAAQLRGIEQGGMVVAILEDMVVTAEQGLQDAEVGHVAGGEQQRARPAGEVRQGRFEFVVGAAVAGNQVGGAAADAEAVGAVLERATRRGSLARPR